MAIVRHIRRRRVDFGGESHSGWLPTGVTQPLPTPFVPVLLDVAIDQEADGTCLLIYESASAEHSGDTWHQSLEEAMEQAEAWLGIRPEEWSEGPPVEGRDER